MLMEIEIKSEIKNLRIVEKAIDEMSMELGIDQNCYGKIMVTAMEAVNNAVMHGNKADPDKKVKVLIMCVKDDIEISVEDEGKGFRYDEVPDPTLPQNIEKITGRGVFLMRKLADEVRFNDKGNKVTLLFRNVQG